MAGRSELLYSCPSRSVRKHHIQSSSLLSCAFLCSAFVFSLPLCSKLLLLFCLAHFCCALSCFVPICLGLFASIFFLKQAAMHREAILSSVVHQPQCSNLSPNPQHRPFGNPVRDREVNHRHPASSLTSRIRFCTKHSFRISALW